MPHLAATNAQLRSLLRRVAEVECDDAPVISAYLNLLPGASQNPQVRAGEIVLRDALRDALDESHEHTAGYDSLEQDAKRIDEQLEQLLPDARGAVLFACHAADLFGWAATAAEIDNDVSVGRHARVEPLARLADFDPAIVALIDSQTLRLFALRSGELVELGLLDDDPDYQRVQAGGWSQSRYQRRVDERREAFAELTAQAIEENLNAENGSVVLLVGDEASVSRVQSELSAATSRALRGSLRGDIRASVEEMNDLCLPELERIRDEDARDAADRLVGAAEGDGMGVSSREEVLAALGIGQVMELLIADRAPDTDQAAVDDVSGLEDLIRQAVVTDARVRFVHDHEGLRERGGVGALLRYRLDRAVNAPTDEATDVGATLA